MTDSKKISSIPICLQKAVVGAFKVQMDEELTVEVTTMSATEALKESSKLDIVSVMGIQSSDFVGSLSLAFPRSTFLGVLEKMLGEAISDITPENADACSELLNIIYASARKDINEAGFDFQPAIPSTISGKELSLPLGQFTSFMRFQCSCKQGTFLMAFSLKRSKGEAGAT